MNVPKQVLNKTAQVWKKLDPSSLRTRLTLGIATVSAVGLSSLALWISWKMQQILIVTHKQQIEQIARRFPRDVELYSEMVPVEVGVKKAIDNLTAENTLIWVRGVDDQIIAQSAALQSGRESVEDMALISLSEMPIQAKVYAVKQGYWVLCGGLLQVKGNQLGQLYVAKDITDEQTMFLAVVWNLCIASLGAIFLITLVIALYIQRSLQPLQQLIQVAGTISADDLSQAQLSLENAPSEVRELAQMWEMMLSRLSKAWEQQRQFVGNVSHELRTPLTIVQGYLQSTLRRGSNLTEPQREALEIATAEADRTIRLLQDLLDLARADSGYLPFHIETILLNELIAEVVGMAEQYSQRRVMIESADSIQVKADRNRLKQVLLNLIDNALKYSDAGTPVILKLDQLRDQARIHVCDQGCGIPLQHQTRIFDRFYRVDEARSRSTGGTGLGLSIVKTLVEGMGGSVTVRSQLGEGTVFTVTLPAQLGKS